MRELYLPLVDFAFIYDNSDAGGVLVAERQEAGSLTINDHARWEKIEKATQ